MVDYYYMWLNVANHDLCFVSTSVHLSVAFIT